jgi:hypothetical protein
MPPHHESNERYDNQFSNSDVRRIISMLDALPKISEKLDELRKAVLEEPERSIIVRLALLEASVAEDQERRIWHERTMWAAILAVAVKMIADMFWRGKIP